MDPELHEMVKDANWANLGRAVLGSAKLGVQKPINSVRSGANKWLGIGSGQKVQQYNQATQANKNMWQGLHAQQGGAGQASRLLSGVNKIRTNPGVQMGVPLAAIGGPMVGINIPGMDTLMNVTNPWWGAAYAGTAGMQGLRANNPYWTNQIKNQAQQGVQLAGSEAMQMINDGFTGRNYQQAIRQKANQVGMGDWLRTLNAPNGQKNIRSLASSLYGGDGYGLVQNQISRQILNAQKGIY